MTSGAEHSVTPSHFVHRFGFFAMVAFALVAILPAIRVSGRAASPHAPAVSIDAPVKSGAAPGQVIASGSLSGLIDHRPWRMGAFGLLY